MRSLEQKSYTSQFPFNYLEFDKIKHHVVPNEWVSSA